MGFLLLIGTRDEERLLGELAAATPSLPPVLPALGDDLESVLIL